MSHVEIRFRRLPEAEVPTDPENDGEPVWARDTKKLFVNNGDGTVSQVGGDGGGAAAYQKVSVGVGASVSLTQDSTFVETTD